MTRRRALTIATSQPVERVALSAGQRAAGPVFTGIVVGAGGGCALLGLVRRGASPIEMLVAGLTGAALLGGAVALTR